MRCVGGSICADARPPAVAGSAGRRPPPCAAGFHDAEESRSGHDALVAAQNAYAAAARERFAVCGGKNGAPFGSVGELVQNYRDRHEAAVKHISAALETLGVPETVVSGFAVWSGRRLQAGVAALERDEKERRTAAARSHHALRLAFIAEALEANPKDVADAFAQLEEAFALAVGQGIYRAAEARERLEAARSEAGRAAFAKLYARDGGQALNVMERFGLSEADQAAFRLRAAQDAKAEAAKKKAAAAASFRALALRAGELEGSVMRTGAPRPTYELKEAAAAMQRLAACEEERREAADWRERAESCERRSGVIREARLLPLPEIERRLGLLRRQGQTPGMEPDKEEQRLYSVIHAERLAALREDPAAAVAPLARALWGATETGSHEAGARLTLALQINDGLPDEQCRVLTKSQAEAVTRMWNERGTDRRTLAGAVAGLGCYAARAVRETGLNKSQKLSFMELIGG